MTQKNVPNESKVEVAKRHSRHLRGTIAQVLASDATHFQHDDVQLLKFHGTYQQDDRDTRKQRRADGLEREHIFMVRVAIPGGKMTAEQYLALDAIADQWTDGSLRLTTRQGIQFHHVVKGDLKPTIAGVNQALLTTLSACGDVERNVMACPAPLNDHAHRVLQDTARAVATELRPASRAYHEIWLNGEKQITTDDGEPFYGDRYLPRKFKTGMAMHGDNCIDVFTQDVGLIGIVENDALAGFNVVVGGGMGMTHSKPDTYAKLAEPLGFIAPENAVATAKTVAAIFRDHGNRADRKHARLKYLIDEWGMDRFRGEFDARTEFNLQPYRPLPPIPAHDHLGPHHQGDGQSFYGLCVASGRIADRDDCQMKTALREIITRYQPGVRVTPQQNLLLTGLDPRHFADIEQTLRQYHAAPPAELSAVRRESMACPALPTCGLALSESERIMPSVLDVLDAELDAVGMRDQPISVRMTGCPNGCARPYTADIAFVGKGPDNYHIYVGGRSHGDRVADLYAADVAAADFASTLRPLLQRWATDRQEDEGLGDFYQRLIDHDVARLRVTGKEQPTRQLIQLEVRS